MAEALLFIGLSSLLTVGVATLVMAALTLRSARKSVELAQNRMEYLREEQARLLAFVREEHQSFKEDLKREREQHLEAQRRAERLNHERLLLRQDLGRVAEELEQEREQERRARLDTERKIDHLKRELLEVREAQLDRNVQQKGSSSLVPTGPTDGVPVTPGLLEAKPLPAQEAKETGKTLSSASSREARASEPGEGPTENKTAGLVVWHPHPDDAVKRGRTSSAGQEDVRSDASDKIKMFRKHYDKYLENYQGYVELAEKLHRMRDNGEVPPGSSAEREWEKRLRRVIEGIERTSARLDTLEEHNPELATDDRVSHRASIARRHSKLASHPKISISGYHRGPSRREAPMKERSTFEREPLPTIWRVPDSVWERIEPILREHDPPKKTGRQRIDQRDALDAIVFRFRTGCQWNRLPEEFPDDSSVHRTFQRWVKLGVLDRIWPLLVEEYGELDGVSWERQTNVTMGKSRFGGTS